MCVLLADLRSEQFFFSTRLLILAFELITRLKLDPSVLLAFPMKLKRKTCVIFVFNPYLYCYDSRRRNDFFNLRLTVLGG